MKYLSIKKYEILSTIFIIILGTLLHFTYNNSIIVGIYSPINESTWEHLKLVYYPMLITTIIGNILYKQYIPNYICIKVKGIILSMLFIVISFYTYTGIIGNNYSILNILLFIISIIISQIYTYRLINNNYKCNNKYSILILLLLLDLFVIFTFYTPHINLFKDPITNTYGIKKITRNL